MLLVSEVSLHYVNARHLSQVHALMLHRSNKLIGPEIIMVSKIFQTFLWPGLYIIIRPKYNYCVAKTKMQSSYSFINIDGFMDVILVLFPTSSSKPIVGAKLNLIRKIKK